MVLTLDSRRGGTALGWFNVKAKGATGDGTTDDYAAIAATIAAASAAGGGVVYFPPGTYLFKSVVANVPSNVQLVGANQYASILKAHSSLGTGARLITIDGNSGVRLRNLRFAGASLASSMAVWMHGATNCAIESCTFDATWGLTLLIGDAGVPSTNCGVVDSVFEGNITSELIEVVDSNGCYIERNRVVGATGNGIVLYCRNAGMLLDNRVTGNYVTGCQTGISDAGGTRTSIIGNHVSTCANSGIIAQVGNTGGLTSTYGTCTGNVVNGCNTADASNSNIYVAAGAASWTLANNVSVNCAGSAGNSGGFGIGIDGAYCTVGANYCALNARNGMYLTTDRNQVVGNTVYNNSVAGINQTDGITIAGKRNVVVGNQAEDDRGTVRMRIGIFLTAASQYNTVIGNRGAVGTSFTSVQDAGTGNILVGNENGTGADTLTVLPGDFKLTGSKVGFYGTAPAVKPTVTGAKGSNAALGSLLTALAGLGLLTDSSTA